MSDFRVVVKKCRARVHDRHCNSLVPLHSRRPRDVAADAPLGQRGRAGRRRLPSAQLSGKLVLRPVDGLLRMRQHLGCGASGVVRDDAALGDFCRLLGPIRRCNAAGGPEAGTRNRATRRSNPRRRPIRWHAAVTDDDP